MLAMNITAALGTSIMAFVLGMLIGTSLGYVIWAEKEDPNSTKRSYVRFGFFKKISPTKQQRRGDDELK
jgi:hypothetical protein